MTERALRRGNWSVQDLERLRQLLPRRGVAVTATLLRRSPACVQRKAHDLLRVPPRRGDWTDGDDALLRGAFGALDLRLLGLMIGRAPSEVRRRVQQLRSRLRQGSWSRQELLALKDLYPTRADSDLEVCLSRPIAEITNMARRLCLAKDKRFAASAAEFHLDGKAAGPIGGIRMPRWTAEQVARLREVYSDRDNLEVARSLGRTVTSVANKAHQLGLRKSPGLLADIGRTNVRCRYGGGSSTENEGLAGA